MTKHSTAHLDRLAEIRTQIIDCVKAGFHLATEIAEEMGISIHTVTNNLIVLERDGEVHRDPVKLAIAGSFNSVWRLGKGADEVTLNSRRLLKCDVPRVILSKEYPVNHVRDPLVAALFGAPKRNAPRCTACGVEQGAGHNRGCIVALVAA